MKKRFLSTLLAAAMVFTMLPVSAMADEAESKEQVPVPSVEETSTAETAEPAEDLTPAEIPNEQTESVPASYSLYEVEAVPFQGTVDGAADDNAELFDGYMMQLARGDIATFTTKAGDYLPAESRRVYNALGAEIEKIAKNGGTAKFTVPSPGIESDYISESQLGMSIIDANGYLSTAACEKAMKMAGLDYSADAVFNALLVDFPYDLYWFDKTIGYSFSYPVQVYQNRVTGELSLRIEKNISYSFTFTVARAYRQTANDNLTVSAALAQGTQTAVQNAKAIVAKAESEDLKDFEKLQFYTDAICALTSYNEAAIADPATAYGDPWQLIYIFDNDTSNQVVCEGYSKGFQFLCDLSTFKSDKVESYIVTGLMGGGTGAGGHMWNVVTMEDGKNYLVDVTNCDDGTIGAPYGLFLVGPDSGTVDTQYTFDFEFTSGTASIYYEYDDDTRATYTKQDLTLAEEDYVPSYDLADTEITINPTSYTYDGAAKEPAVTVTYRGTELVKDTHYTVEYQNNIDAGTAKVVLTGVGVFSGKVEKEFTINPQPLTLTGSNVKAKTYDGTTDAEVTDLALKDSTGKAVTVPYTVTAAFDDPNAGTGKTVNVTVTLDNANYTLADPTLILTGEITKASVEAADGLVQVTNNRAGTYTFNLMDLLPALDGDKTYGTTTFTPGTPNVTGTEYLSASDITTSGNTLTVNVKKVETDVEKEIATVTYTIETQNYTVTTTGKVTVKAVNKKVATVTAPTAESGVTYDGKAHTGYTGAPSVTGGYTGNLEVTYTDKDGKVSKDAPVNAGTYTITFKVPDSDPDYTGFATVEFTIAPKALTDAMVSQPADTTYDGAEKTPAVTVTDGSLLTTDDYTVTYKDNTDAGTATVEVTGKNNYTGTVTRTFKINPKEITLTWANTDGRVYGDGKTVTAEIPADALVAGDTVTVTVTNGDKTDAGSYTATAALDGADKDNYKLTNGNQKYTIAAKTLTDAMVSKITGTFVYDGTAKTPAVTVTDGSVLTTNDYTVTYKDNTDAGTATAIVTGKGNYTGTVEVTFTIDPADLSTATAAVEGSFVYNGKEQTPVPTVTLNGVALVYGKDFTLTYTNNKNAGTATVKVTGKGNYTGTIDSLTFNIAKAPLKVTVADLEVTVGGKVVPGLVFDTLQGSDVPEIDPAPVFFLYNEKDADKKEVTPEDAAKKTGTYIIVWTNANNVQFPNLTANYDITVDSTNGTLVVTEQQDDGAAPAAPSAPSSNVPDSAYTTCPACGYHNWTETTEGYRCDHCGHLITTAPTLNVIRNGSYRPAAPGKNVTPVIPQTSDDMPVVLLIGLAVIGMLGLGVTVISKKRRDK